MSLNPMVIAYACRGKINKSDADEDEQLSPTNENAHINNAKGNKRKDECQTVAKSRKISQRKESKVMIFTNMHDVLQDDDNEVDQITNADKERKIIKMTTAPILYYNTAITIDDSVRNNNKGKREKNKNKNSIKVRKEIESANETNNQDFKVEDSFKEKVMQEEMEKLTY